jgi:hypothetical protein
MASTTEGLAGAVGRILTYTRPVSSIAPSLRLAAAARYPEPLGLAAIPAGSHIVRGIGSERMELMTARDEEVKSDTIGPATGQCDASL